MQIQALICIFEQDRWRVWRISREHHFGDEMHTASSWLLVCPECHEVWAKHLLEGFESIAWARSQYCAEHGKKPTAICLVPGSLLLEEGIGVIDVSLLNALPDELIKREFTMHLKAIENGYISEADLQYTRAFPSTWRERVA